MKKNWFDEWFNTNEYLEVYKHRNEIDAERHINFILSKVDLKPKSKVLDMACGAGRHSILLAKKGYELTGIDLSENLLSEARRIAESEKLNIKFVKADIRNFYTDEKFDLVLNLFTSFGYFEKDEENFLIIKKAYDFLECSGIFILDFFNKEFLLKNLIPLSKEKNNGKTIIQKRFVRSGRIEKIIEIIKDDSKKTFYESVKLYSPEQLKNRLVEYGFKILNIYGNFDGSDFQENISERFIAICKK
ncbi:MAG: class I SAM-dependent methyltransferase [Ignavibacterium sp.]|nr:class I SAM-dependent methyltransferase [Ignavibacterium sp.]